jgi:hypothetical protein
VFVHRLDVHLWHDDGGANPTFGAGGAEQISPCETVIFLRARARSTPSPDAGYGAVLANPGFVLEPDFERLVWDIFRRERGTEQRREVFLKVSCAASSL